MATRKWGSSAVGIYRLLVEQQAGSGVAAASRRLWGAELSLAAAAPRRSISSGNSGAVNALAALAASQPGGLPGLRGCLLPAAQGPQPCAALHTATSRLFSMHQDSVKSHLTQPPPLAGVAPQGQLPHKSLPPGQHLRPAAGAAAEYEAADAEECDEVMEEYSEARRRVRCA